MRASPRADDMRPRPRRAAGLPEVQEGWQAPGCNAAPACPALAPAAAAGKLNAKLKSDFRCYPNNGHAATASACPFCAKAQSRCAPARCAGARAEKPVVGRERTAIGWWQGQRDQQAYCWRATQDQDQRRLAGNGKIALTKAPAILLK